MSGFTFLWLCLLQIFSERQQIHVRKKILFICMFPCYATHCSKCKLKIPELTQRKCSIYIKHGGKMSKSEQRCS